MNYYNENDPYVAQWLRNLIEAGHLAPGHVDDRSIEDVTPNDLKGYTQAHFFAGIGGWPLALDRAGWPRDRPAWTGSCPCQPFSASGKSGGFDDERHLWPAWFHLIEVCKPATLFGEQVASKAAEPWLDLVQADLEAMGYAFGSVAFPAAGIGAPHIRDRTYWLGHADDTRSQGHAGDGGEARRQGPERPAAEAGLFGGLADSARIGRREEREDGERVVAGDRAQGIAARPVHGSSDNRPGPTNGQWADADWLGCRDEKWRPVEPGTFPLVDDATARVGRLRAYGNCVVIPQAEHFIEASGLI